MKKSTSFHCVECVRIPQDMEVKAPEVLLAPPSPSPRPSPQPASPHPAPPSPPPASPQPLDDTLPDHSFDITLEVVENPVVERPSSLCHYEPIFKGTHITLELESKNELPSNLLEKLKVRLNDFKFLDDNPLDPLYLNTIYFTPSTCGTIWTGIYGEDFGEEAWLVFSLETTDSSGKPTEMDRKIRFESCPKEVDFDNESTADLTDDLVTEPFQSKEMEDTVESEHYPSIGADDMQEEQTIFPEITMLPDQPTEFKDFKFTVKVTKMTKIDIERRDEHMLCSEEQGFVAKRKKFVFDKMKEKFENLQMEDVPTIAIIGSGGGMRAVVGMSGALTALEEEHILEYSMYTAGLSGSAWYLLTLYAYDDKFEPKTVNNHIREKLKKNYWIYFKFAWRIWKYVFHRDRVGYGKYYTITNIFGELIGHLLLGKKCTNKWSEQAQKLNTGEIPMPLIAALHVHHTLTIDYHHEWIELSPYQVLLPGYRTAIKMNHFGSQFYSGFCRSENKELPIHFLQGICGSAFAVVRDYRPQDIIDFRGTMYQFIGSLYIKQVIWSFFNRFDRHFVAKIPNVLFGISKISQLETTHTRKDKCTTGTNRRAKGLTGVIIKFCSGVKDKIWVILTKLIGLVDYVKDIIWFQDSASSFDRGYVEKEDTMMLMDAGIAFNSPYPPVLHPSRNVDIVLSFDFSDRYEDGNLPFEELRKAAKWAKERDVNFPKLDPQIQEWENEWKDGIRKEVYVLQGSPTIFHFVLINESFRKNGDDTCNFDIFPRYSTFKFRYSNMEFDNLIKLVQHNIKENKNEILQCIRKHINKKATKLQEHE